MPSKKQFLLEIEQGRDNQDRQAKYLGQLKTRIKAIEKDVAALFRMGSRHDDEIRETLLHANSAMSYCRKHTHASNHHECPHDGSLWPLLFHDGDGLPPVKGSWCECGALLIGSKWYFPIGHLAVPAPQLPEKAGQGEGG